ncbi:MAG: SGNH/GDSL hydrolase family protein [Ideonella sp.]
MAAAHAGLSAEADNGAEPAGAAASRSRLGRGARWLLVAVGAFVLLACGWLGLDKSRPQDWLPAFTAALHGPLEDGPPFDDQSLRFSDVTLRQFVPLALPGNKVRLQFSNQFGDAALRVAAIHVAWRAAAGGAAIRSGTDKPVTFDGQAAVQIAAGRSAWSDPVELPPSARADLAVSVYLKQPTPRASWHLTGSRTSYRSKPGEHVASVDFPIAHYDRSIYFLAGVAVETASDAGLWVAFGDSITDGNGHSVDQDASWPARVTQIWRNAAAKPPVGFLNAGVSGGRLLSSEVGPSGLQRFDRDVLDLKGVRGVTVLIGINDLAGQAQASQMPSTLQALIAAQSQLVERAHKSGLKIVGATLTPAQGGVYGRPEVERARQQLNRWIRESGGFDAVVDFDAVLRDPASPDRMRGDLTHDQLHPNDAGYRVMADAVVRTLAEAGLERH